MNPLNTFYRFLVSYKTSFTLLFLLGLSSAFGTFIENDYGTLAAKEVIYHSWWHKALFALASLNLLLVIAKTKMYRFKTRFGLHLSFLLILLGAMITHYWGVEGTMSIREGEKSSHFNVGNERMNLNFSLSLLDFKLKRYPGSRAPSEFQSDLILIDGEQRKKISVYMNHTFIHRGYKFFQTSYDEDEKGTILSVNKDPGVEITYLGYTLLFICLLLNLLSKKSRFQYLRRKISVLLILISFIPIKFVYPDTERSFIVEYLEDYRENSKELGELFGRLIVQAPDGRMKPLDTQNREVLYKLTGGRNTWNGLNANQVALGMFARPSLWKKVNLIRVKTDYVKEVLGVSKRQKLVRFIDFFDVQGRYKLTEGVERASQKPPAQRGVIEKDFMEVDERLNIAFMAYRGTLLTLFPKVGDENHKWVDFKTMFTSFNSRVLKRSVSRLLDETYNRNYEKALEQIPLISEFQKKFGQKIIPSEKKIKAEIWYNNTSLFFKLSLFYLAFGFIFLLYGLFNTIREKAHHKFIEYVQTFCIFSFLIVHSLALGIRWYISGYIPMSNTYETMVYIAYAAVLSGFFFLRKSLLATSAVFMMAGVFIFTAYLGEINPEITSLVPVLKSYWLSIHVSVITASYGFFGVGAFIGLIAMVLFIAQKKSLSKEIQKLTYLNEMVLTLGLVLLVIGTFLGGIWANESWGRYWGWDPKETWAYISILVYTIVLHLRLFPKVYGSYLFNTLSIFSFSSILMTYFGVNFYLAGMHSYAKGDPVPIPNWVYITVSAVFLLVVLAYPSKRS